MKRIWRTCSDCKKHMLLDEFSRDKNRPHGRSYLCKPCVRARVKAWTKKNTARARATGKRWRENNREKMRASSRASYARNAERLRARSRELSKRPEAKAASRRDWLKRKYGLTPEDWTFRFGAQGGACAICRNPDPGSKRGWHTDHDHRTGKVRGILCHKCNVLLGAAVDSPAILELAKAYLRR
jgi:hypothetical protein